MLLFRTIIPILFLIQVISATIGNTTASHNTELVINCDKGHDDALFLRVIKIKTAIWQVKHTEKEKELCKSFNGPVDRTKAVSGLYDGLPGQSAKWEFDETFKNCVELYAEYECVQAKTCRKINYHKKDYIPDELIEMESIDRKVDIDCPSTDGHIHTVQVKSAKWVRISDDKYDKSLCTKFMNKQTHGVWDETTKEWDITESVKDKCHHKKRCQVSASGMTINKIMRLKMDYWCVKGYCPHDSFKNKHGVPTNLKTGEKDPKKAVDLIGLAAHAKDVHLKRLKDRDEHKRASTITKFNAFYFNDIDQTTFSRISKDYCQMNELSYVYNCKATVAEGANESDWEWRCEFGCLEMPIISTSNGHLHFAEWLFVDDQ